MLVHNVEIVKGAQGTIPSWACIWAHGVPNVGDKGRAKDTCFSCLKRTYHIVSARPAIEANIFVRGLAEGNDCVPKHEVQGGVQIVDGVSNDAWDILGQLLWCDGDERSPFRILLNAESVVVVPIDKRLNGRVKLRDVLIGPFDL